MLRQSRRQPNRRSRRGEIDKLRRLQAVACESVGTHYRDDASWRRAAKQKRGRSDRPGHAPFTVRCAVPFIEQALEPGAKLPEDAIGERFGASRTIVRHALGQLASGRAG